MQCQNLLIFFEKVFVNNGCISNIEEILKEFQQKNLEMPFEKLQNILNNAKKNSNLVVRTYFDFPKQKQTVDETKTS